MTCRVQVVAVDGSSTPARALLDSGSSTSFISERLAQRLRLPRTPHRAQIVGIGNLSHKSANQSVVRFKVSPIWPSERIFDVEAVVLPKVTCDLPVHPMHLDGNWKHLEGLQLADPDFGTPVRVDVLLGIDIFSSALLQGRRHGGSNLPIALETCFGWVVTGNVQGNHPQRIISHHASILSDNELLQRFWELEENNPQQYMTPDEEAVVTHFRETHRFDSEG